jgi:parallel beta-helix repeat protein
MRKFTKWLAGAVASGAMGAGCGVDSTGASASAVPAASLAALPAAAGAARSELGSGKLIQVVRPGQSIQAALDQAAEGGVVYVLPSTYRETASATNGLNITRSVHLVGLPRPRQPVVLENSGGQRNGIVAVPADHTECMSCHASLAPPFELREGVDATPLSRDPVIHGLTISGITIEGFSNNGLFTRNVDGFAFVDVHSVDNPNYGIFPTLSSNGLITRCSATGSDDSGIWIETSEDVAATHNLVEGNVNGFEVSNSDDVLLAHNEVRDNTIGMALFFLPDIFEERPDTRRLTVHGNQIHDNNKPNTARPGSILSMVPAGVGILNVGADDSLIANNVVQNHHFLGIGVVDYCLIVQGTAFDCGSDPEMTPEFIADNEATNNRIVENTVVNNGTNPDPSSPFAFAASDLALLTAGDHGNCYAGNVFGSFFSLLGVLPPCP